MCSTLVAVEPTSALPSSLMPRVPIQMRSQRSRVACFTMDSAKGPTSTLDRYFTPAASSLRRADASFASPSCWY